MVAIDYPTLSARPAHPRVICDTRHILHCLLRVRNSWARRDSGQCRFSWCHGDAGDRSRPLTLVSRSCMSAFRSNPCGRRLEFQRTKRIIDRTKAHVTRVSRIDYRGIDPKSRENMCVEDIETALYRPFLPSFVTDYGLS